ncbi:ste16 protein [Phaffia rhodozyma]|uniref:Ste16 protein n=1 Tax=Phaffia rhodozyma TaxID=264483 RepID=A0A0F7SNH5_PHARH|nr:ste16 protein [Phaffia rhodozyma]
MSPLPAAILSPSPPTRPPLQVQSQSDDSFRTASSSFSSFARIKQSIPAELTPLSDGDGQAVTDRSLPVAKALPIVETDKTLVSERLEALLKSLVIENKIKDGAENMLQVLESAVETGSDRNDLRKEVEGELRAANKMIVTILNEIQELKEHPEISRALQKKVSQQAFPSNQSTRRLPPKLSSANSSSSTTNSHNNVINHPASTSSSYSAMQNMRHPRPISPEDDFQTILTVARALVRDLDVQSRDDGKKFEDAGRLVGVLKKNRRVRYDLAGREDVLEIIFALISETSSKELRATGYRVFRHLLVDSEGWKTLERMGIDWYIIRTFTRDVSCAPEKIQALKLIRSVLNLPPSPFTPPLISTPSRSKSLSDYRNLNDLERRGFRRSAKVPLSDSVIRTLVSLAENGDDPFRFVSLETLAEIALLDIQTLVPSNAIRVLLQCFSEGPHELAPAIAHVFLYVIDCPERRESLNPGMDIEMALSGFTDVHGSGEAYLSRLRSSSKVVSTLLKSWSGFLYLCMDDRKAIRSLVDSLRVPTVQMREVLLDMFFDIFRIKTPFWYHAFLDDRRLTMYSKDFRSNAYSASGKEKEDPDKLTLIDHYVALVLSVFIEVGLVDALIDIVEEALDILSRKATLLVGELLALSNKLLPSTIAARIQSLPRLFSHAAKFAKPEERGKASSALSAIDSLNRNRSRLRDTTAVGTKEGRKRSNPIQDPLLRGQRQVENVKMRMGLQMDDRQFQVLLNDTQVLFSRDHNKWNYDVLMGIIQGPLLNPRRLEEALKASKFGRRLLSFFHPLNHRFSDVKKTKPNLRWVKLGCALITTLLSNPDGVAFLAADKLLPQLYECFAELDHYHGSVNSDPLLSKHRLDDTLTSGYFEMIGTLSSHPEGIRLLENFKMFTLFYHLSDLRSREDLIKAIIENLDYTSDGHSRIVLSKALTSSYMHIRLYATEHLGQLVLSSADANPWTLRLLITQLYDPSPEVCELAVQFLEEACERTDVLELVVQMRPFLDHLGDIGHPLLLRFLSTSVGFRYLHQVHYLNRELDYWFHERNEFYVVQVEVFLSRAFYPAANDDPDDLIAFDGTVPAHFYGELVKTAEGCQMLREQGHFGEFAEFVRQNGMECVDSDVINKLKSVLWAVGHIGSTRGGFPFLEEEDLLEVIVDIAEQSSVLSVRGTCYFILGLISFTRPGADFLMEFDWEATNSSTGQPTGLCIPIDSSKFSYIQPWKPIRSLEPSGAALVMPTSIVEQSVLSAIGNLSNHVQASASFSILSRLKRTHRDLFSSIPLFYRALHILSSTHFRLPIRRFIFDLFDIPMTPSTILGLINSSLTLKLEPALPDASTSSLMIGGARSPASSSTSMKLKRSSGLENLGRSRSTKRSLKRVGSKLSREDFNVDLKDPDLKPGLGLVDGERGEEKGKLKLEIDLSVDLLSGEEDEGRENGAEKAMTPVVCSRPARKVIGFAPVR